MDKTIKIISLLRKEYPKSKTSLSIRSPLQCLIATILSAQCTDKRVNFVTKDLFKKYKKAKDYANVDLKKLEKDLSSINFYKNKAKSIKKTCKILVEEHGGKVPNKLNELIKLQGVGRKTANVVLGNAFQIHEGYVVDTHNLRLSYRLKLTNNKNSIKVEKDLVKIIPKKDWLDLSHMFIDHGRAICKAPIPICSKCLLTKICPKIEVKKRK
ncbi:MAG: endonuclease III [Candidatus Nanoarchaeia archaeon]|jgi:endonuclease-3|nr:endonuclease III [Candidatus Nanoarchaeia archaeon]|tara:strand:- start:19182 stop:19817 length:636 start_codon:yes stop_codon:yes gene_type:complete